jgi:hypothetical protein
MRNVYGEDNLIVWQKWFDPFGADDEISIDSNITQEDVDDNTEEAEGIDDHMSHPQRMRAIATPMGLIPYTENTASSKIFNFWVGHSNFNINENIIDIIENTDGVETLDVFTRYRFRIAIGKVFDDARVMKEINDQAYRYLHGSQ